MNKQEFLLRVTQPDGSPFGNFGEVHESLQGFGGVLMDREIRRLVQSSTFNLLNTSLITLSLTVPL